MGAKCATCQTSESDPDPCDTEIGLHWQHKPSPRAISTSDPLEPVPEHSSEVARGVSTSTGSHLRLPRGRVDGSSRKAAACLRLREGMLRGTPMSQILLGGGHILRNSAGSAATFELSQPVEAIDVFISHNWSTSRPYKFGVLALHFNFWHAVAAMWIAVLLTIPLTMMEILPTFEFITTGNETSVQSLTCHFVGFGVLLLALGLWHEVGGRLRCSKGPVAFLDKTCIHQTDAALKHEGISSLAAFLMHSKVMVIVYSETYLRKLWTVYELASMLVLHPGDHVVVIPYFLMKTVAFGTTIFFLATTALRVFAFRSMSVQMNGKTLLISFGAATAVPSAVAFTWAARKWAHERADIARVVRTFSIKDAACFDEADRPVVQGNIIVFMRALSLVEEPTGEEDEDDKRFMEDLALNAFDALVHAEVPAALATSFGRVGIPVRYVVIMFTSQILRIPDHVAPWLCGLQSSRYFWVAALEHAVIGLAIGPLFVAALTWIAEQRAGERGHPLSAVWLVLQLFIALGVFFAMWYVLDTLAVWSLGDDDLMWRVLYGLMASALLVLTAFVYRPVRVQHVVRRRLNSLVDLSSLASEQSGLSHRVWRMVMPGSRPSVLSRPSVISRAATLEYPSSPTSPTSPTSVSAAGSERPGALWQDFRPGERNES